MLLLDHCNCIKKWGNENEDTCKLYSTGWWCKADTTTCRQARLPRNFKFYELSQHGCASGSFKISNIEICKQSASDTVIILSLKTQTHYFSYPYRSIRRI